MDPQLTWFWVHVLPSWLLCDSGFRYDQTEIHLWTCKRYLTFGCAFVFTRSEKYVLWTKKKIHISCCFKRKCIIALFALHIATQTQTSNVFEVECLHLKASHISILKRFLAQYFLYTVFRACGALLILHLLQIQKATFDLDLTPESKTFEFWVCELWTFNISYRYLHLQSCVISVLC